MPSTPPGSKDKCSLVSVPRGTVSPRLPLVAHVFTAVGAIREGVAPAVYWTFSPERQVPGWESPDSLSVPSLCTTSEHSQDKGRPQAKELRVRGGVEVLSWCLLVSRPIPLCASS